MGTVASNNQVQGVVLSLLGFVVIVVFGGALYAFVLSIFQFIFSRGEEEKIKKAWNNIRYMIIGILLSIFLLFGVPLLLEHFEVPGYEEYTFQRIIQEGGDNFSVILESLDFLGEETGGTSNDYENIEQDLDSGYDDSNYNEGYDL